MTAIVGFMNKRGVAVAADSAVTLGNTHKVVNSGNKIFTLSKHAPVGIATYGNASFMETPWEIVVKLYRKQLERKKYNLLEDYISSFVDFLHKEDFFMNEEYKRQILFQRAVIFYDISVEKSKKIKGYSPNEAPVFLMQELNTCKQVNSKAMSLDLPEMRTYKYKHFIDYFYEIFITNIGRMPLLQTKEMQDAFLQSFYQFLLVYVQSESDSGLVFFGYGEKEIYPSIVNLIVADSFDGRLRYKRMDGNSFSISTGGHTAVVIPFAQVDVSQTIIRGINPNFIDILRASLVSILNGYRDAILSAIPSTPNNANSINIIKTLNHDALAQQFVNNATGEFNKHYTDILMSTVAGLSKEDMANLAESLVELTSIVRRMSPTEETVGGPIDVAVVSKGDGFIWLKRKHYFDPKLNANFISTYNDD